MAGEVRASSHRGNHYDLLRLCLALMVILSHTPELIDGERDGELLTRVFHTISFGDLGVTGFFLLSGFLIVGSWSRKPDLRTFLRNRTLRIVPGFVVASLLSVLVVGWLGAEKPNYFSHLDIPRTVLDLCSLKEPSTPAVFEDSNYPLVNGPLYTIRYEFRCYLLVALVGVLGAFRFRWLWPVLCAAGAGVVLWPKSYLWDSPTWLAWLAPSPYLTARFVSIFAAGACFYLFRKELSLRGRWALLASGVLVSGLFSVWTAHVALVTAGAYALFWLGSCSWRWLGWLRPRSDISYGVYLYGWPIQKLLLWHWPELAFWQLFPASASLALLAGWISWNVIEKPALGWKR